MCSTVQSNPRRRRSTPHAARPHRSARSTREDVYTGGPVQSRWAFPLSHSLTITPIRGSNLQFYRTGSREGAENADIWQVDKDADGRVTQTKLFGVRVSDLTLPEPFMGAICGRGLMLD